MTNNLQELRELIIKETREGLYVGPVTLSMILMAIKDRPFTCYFQDGFHFHICDWPSEVILVRWDLTKDGLER